MSTDLRRLAAFAALAGFASHHWFMLVEGAETWRWIVCVAIATALAGELALMRGRRWARGLPGALAATGLFAATLFGGLAAIGIPVSYLVPGGWQGFEAELARGLAGVSQIDTPYAGPDPWTRLGILAAVPLMTSAAFLSAFWPAGSGRAGRTLGLSFLIALYATSVTWEAPSAELARGALLFLFVAAVLWLPGASMRRAVPALASVALAVAVALPLASRVNASDPFISYTSWSVFGDDERIGFNWNHTYGPLDWPQDGTEVLRVEADEPTYWKAYVLDEFDGDAWSRASDAFGELGDGYELAGSPDELVAAHPEWTESYTVRMTGLQSRLAVTSGTRPEIEGLDLGDVSGDGTAASATFEIPSGSEYSLTSYVPDPSPRQLRRADGPPGVGAERYTTLAIEMALSAEEEAIGRPPPIGYAVQSPFGVELSAAEKELVPGAPPIDEVVEGTPYAKVLDLTRRLVAGARSDYAAVSRIQRFLNANYTYDQDVEPRRDPLPAFLLRDRRGYCQQFAGAMALMLRMAGIPSRVVSGFAPGVREDDGSFSVADTDAHSWVEVLYPGVGWVTVDPTPAQTPAHTNVTLPNAGLNSGIAERGLGRAFTEREGERDRPSEVKDRAGRSEEEGAGVPLAGLVLFGACGGAAGVILRRRRRLRSPDGGALQLRELQEAMRATGSHVRPGTTLAAIQSRLSADARPEAARYAAALLESRYGRRPRRRPGPPERRAFRWSLARRSGPLGWWRALRAVPPGGPRA